MNLVDQHLFDPRQFWPGETLWDGPLAVVDLAAAADGASDGQGDGQGDARLPPCPVIGIGPRGTPLAGLCDAVVEAPVSAEVIARQVLAMPHAAAVIVQLLRLLPGLPVEQGLVAESLAYSVLQGSAEHAAWLATSRPVLPPARSEGRVELERIGGRLVITLDHPASGNAIDRAMRDALFEAFALAALDPEIVQVSLRGRGRTFSLGAELDEFGTTTDPATAHALRCRTLPAHHAARVAGRLDVHVQGACVGSGLELAAWGARLTASRDAWFHLPELAMGILPGAGGCVSLARRIGRQRAALLILSGKRINARQALALGLIDGIEDYGPGDDGGADIG